VSKVIDSRKSDDRIRRRRICELGHRFTTYEEVTTMIKQVIVMRTDLNMRKGKMVAQGCHSSMKIFFDRIEYVNGEPMLSINQQMKEWMEGIFTKICLQVSSEQELLEIKVKAERLKLPVALIEDNGLTEFKGVKTITCLAIGPDFSEKIDEVTGHLKLL
jgi:PTH2 family peptidyl-tRNA hydrolase